MTIGDTILSIVKLLAGLGVFLIGMRILSDNLEKLAGSKLKALFNKTNDRKLTGVGMGALTTAVIQSSAVTTCMVVGFVNTGIMSLEQATAVIMGANIGTTITAQIAALGSFSFTTYITAFAGIGIFMVMFAKKDNIKSLGYTLAGLGLLFVGLSSMSASMSEFTKSAFVTNLLSSIRNPFLLLFIGIALTALVQSSSAITSVVISMAIAGITIGDGGNCMLYVILGTNIGSCVTAIISSIGTSTNAQRACAIHLLFNVIGSLIFMIVLLCWKDFMAVTFAKWFSAPATQIAMFHTFFNVLCAILFLPFTKVLVKLAQIILPDKKKEDESAKLCMYIDKRFLATPAMAIGQLRLEVVRMAGMAMESYKGAYAAFMSASTDNSESVMENNKRLAEVSDAVTDYLVQVSSVGLPLEDEREVNALHNNAGDIVRISDLADNLLKYTRREISFNLEFSAVVKEQLGAMNELLLQQYAVVEEIMRNQDKAMIQKSDELENKIDRLRKEMINGHIDRLNKGECKSENNNVFVNLVSNLERIGDHLNYIAHSMD